MRLLSFFSSLAEAFRIESYGPRYSEWPRRQADRTHHLHDDSLLADALGVKRVELVSSADVPVKAHARKKPANPKREALHQALGRAVGGVK